MNGRPGRRKWLQATGATTLAAVMGGCRPRMMESARVREQPVRLDPWRGIDPNRDDPALVALAREHLAPRMEQIGISSSLHYAYLWGEAMSRFGVSLDRFLDKTLEGDYSGSNSPLFYRESAGGVRTGTRQHAFNEAHADQTLAMLGALGVESSRSIGAGISLRQAIVSLANRFGQHTEFEWSTLALLHYAPDLGTWRNRWGQTISFDHIARRLIDEGFGAGSCSGTHRLQVAAAMLQCDGTFRTLSHRERNLLNVFLHRAADRLLENQHKNGGWGEDWPRHHSAKPALESTLLVTGHHLEWLERIGHRLEVPPERWERAIDYCRDTLKTVVSDEQEQRPRLCPLTHAVKTVLQHQRATQAKAAE